jgi:hypothetical protein
MPPVFRHVPPPEIVNDLCKACGLTDVSDSKAFLKEGICLRSFQDCLPELEPYYVPCKARDFLLLPLTPQRAIVILRHVLKAHDKVLDSFEKSMHNKRMVWYRILSKLDANREGEESKEICVEFV